MSFGYRVRGDSGLWCCWEASTPGLSAVTLCTFVLRSDLRIRLSRLDLLVLMRYLRSAQTADKTIAVHPHVQSKSLKHTHTLYRQSGESEAGDGHQGRPSS